jgi:hypothetical protein
MHIHNRSARLGYFPAYHLHYVHGEKYTPSRADIVPARYDALIGAADNVKQPRVCAELHPSPFKSQVRAVRGCGSAGRTTAGAAARLIRPGFPRYMSVRVTLALCRFLLQGCSYHVWMPAYSFTNVDWACCASCLVCLCMCAQAAAAASVAGLGLGVMPLTSLALGIDPGFLSLAGMADCAVGPQTPSWHAHW